MGRKRIGLIFNLGAVWTGGHYYLLNLLKAFSLLPSALKPHVVIFSKNGVAPQLDGIQYEFISVVPLKKKVSLLERVLKRIGLLNKGYVSQYRSNFVSYVYPCFSVDQFGNTSLKNLKKIYWIPDFQHKYLPQFFPTNDLAGREKSFKGISETEALLVLSSNNSKEDYLKFYPENKSKIKILPFATVLPGYSDVVFNDLMRKFEIEQSYFISPNQFWVHKNHNVLIEAAKILHGEGHKFQIILTGKEEDYRSPGYAEELKATVKKLGLTEIIKFLGFIDRREQLQLINNSMAVIQPSLFEGWSTVVEDAKALNQVIIASNLDVHKEQCGELALYFDPKDAKALSTQIKYVLANKPKRPDFQYKDRLESFALCLLNLDIDSSKT